MSTVALKSWSQIKVKGSTRSFLVRAMDCCIIACRWAYNVPCVVLLLILVLLSVEASGDGYQANQGICVRGAEGLEAGASAA